MPDPTPETIIASVANIADSIERLSQTATTIPGPAWEVVSMLLQGQAQIFRGTQRLLERVVESTGAL